MSHVLEVVKGLVESMLLKPTTKVVDGFDPAVNTVDADLIRAKSHDGSKLLMSTVYSPVFSS